MNKSEQDEFNEQVEKILGCAEEQAKSLLEQAGLSLQLQLKETSESNDESVQAEKNIELTSSRLDIDNKAAENPRKSLSTTGTIENSCKHSIPIQSTSTNYNVNEDSSYNDKKTDPSSVSRSAKTLVSNMNQISEMTVQEDALMISKDDSSQQVSAMQFVESYLSEQSSSDSGNKKGESSSERLEDSSSSAPSSNSNQVSEKPISPNVQHSIFIQREKGNTFGPSCQKAIGKVRINKKREGFRDVRKSQKEELLVRLGVAGEENFHLKKSGMEWVPCDLESTEMTDEVKRELEKHLARRTTSVEQENYDVAEMIEKKYIEAADRSYGNIMIKNDGISRVTEQQRNLKRSKPLTESHSKNENEEEDLVSVQSKSKPQIKESKSFLEKLKEGMKRSASFNKMVCSCSGKSLTESDDEEIYEIGEGDERVEEDEVLEKTPEKMKRRNSFSNLVRTLSGKLKKTASQRDSDMTEVEKDGKYGKSSGFENKNREHNEMGEGRKVDSRKKSEELKDKIKSVFRKARNGSK